MANNLVSSADIAAVRDIKRARVFNIINNAGLSYDVDLDIAHVRGSALIKGGAANYKAMARRAAISDVRRNLLLLKRMINLNLNELSVIKDGEIILSGYVPPLIILDEFVSGDLYFVEAETSLRDLMRGGE